MADNFFSGLAGGVLTGYKLGTDIQDRRKERQTEEIEGLARRHAAIFYDDDGTPLETADLVNDPDRVALMTDYYNNKVFDDIRNANGRQVKVIGFTPTEDGRYGVDLEVNEKGKSWLAPLTRNRSTDPEDEVPTFTVGDMRRMTEDYLRGKSEAFAKTDSQGRLVRWRGERLGDMAGSTRPPPQPSARGLGAAGVGGAGDVATPGGVPSPKGLLDFVAQHESGGNYNAIYGNAGATEDLSQYTLNEVLRKSAEHGKRTGSSAIGRYQFLTKTLKGLKDELDLTGNEPFTPELQDRLGYELLRRRGYDKFAAGEIDAATFGSNLANEWAALPKPDGRSAYHGDSMGNRALTSWDAVQGALGGTPIDPRMASSAPMGDEPLAPPGSLPDRATRPSGLDSTVRFAARFPGEVSPLEVERMANTGRLAAPVTSKDGLNVDVSDPYTLEAIASRRGPAPGRGLKYITEPGGGMSAVYADTGEPVWRRPPPEAPVDAKSAADRLKLVDTIGEVTLGERWTQDEDLRNRWLNTTVVMGLDITDPAVQQIMPKAIRITERIERQNERGLAPWTWLRSGVTFDTATVGLAAAQLGLSEKDESALQSKLIAPLTALIGQGGAPEAVQAEILGELVRLQGPPNNLSPSQATEALIEAMGGEQPAALPATPSPAPERPVAEPWGTKGLRGIGAAP
jgi:muramidase (phage lysozyme)